MFTGIIEELGRVEKVTKTADGLRLTISAEKVIKDISIGSSMAINGVCLTVVAYNKNSFEADVMAETIKKTNISEFREGGFVNMERPIKISGRLEGHFVLGHVDGIGIIKRGLSPFFGYPLLGGVPDEIEITIIPELARYIVPKGSIAIDGISLTVVDVADDTFRVAIIPYTSKNTTLGFKGIGDKVNLEFDIIAKHIERMLGVNSYLNKNNKLTMEFLREHGY